MSLGDKNPTEMLVGTLESTEGIIKREDGFIYASGVLQRSGVFNSGLKLYEEFEESIPSMIGIDLLRGEHPTDEQGNFRPHNSDDDIIGVVIDAIKDPQNKLARGIFKINEARLTPEEITSLEDGRGWGVSPAYWCDKVPLPEPKLWEDGTPYSFIEKKQFLYDSFATPKNPACKKCGILINSKQEQGEDTIGKKRSPEEIKEAFGKLKAEAEASFMVNQALDEIALQSEILDVLECTSDFDSGMKAKQLLVQILKVILGTAQPSPFSAMSQNNKPKEEGMEPNPTEIKPVVPEDIKLMVNAAVEEASKPLKDELIKATTTIEEQAKVIEGHKATLAKIETAEADRTKKEGVAATAAATAAEEQRKTAFLSKLKPGIAKTAEEIQKLWDLVKPDMGKWIIDNPDKMVFDANSEPIKYTPKGLPIVPALSANSAEERDQKFRDMGIKPASDLIKEIYPERK